MLDRIDICIELGAVSYTEWFSDRVYEKSDVIRERVCRARKIQKERYANENFKTNALIPSSKIEAYCSLGKYEKELMVSAFQGMELSGRGYHRILKVARTIADLDGSEDIDVQHIAEALQYRSLDRKYWGN